jgi:hypothetical protein
MILAWKSNDEAIAEYRLRTVLQAVTKRAAGGRIRRLCVDATNERYFASRLRRQLAGEAPVELVVGSESADKPGEEPMNMKQWTGSRLIAELDDNHLTLPQERYIREDWRLVKKEKGLLVTTVDVDGKHGDTFDAAKLALYAVNAGGPAEASATAVGAYGSRNHDPITDRRYSARPDPSEDAPVASGSRIT